MNEDIRAYKYQVTFNMQKVSIAIGFRCKIMIVIRKGKQKFESQSKIPLDNAKFEAKFNETIKFDSIYLKDMKTGKYLEEKNQVTIVIVTHKGNKTAGVFTLKPADFLNQGKMASVREASPLQRCPDKKARCYYGLSFMRIKELTIEELQEEREQNPNITVVDDIDFTMLQSLNMSDDLQKKLDGVDDGYRGGDMLGGLSSDRERPKAHDCSKHEKKDGDCSSPKNNKYDRSFKRKRSSGVIKMQAKLAVGEEEKEKQQAESEDVAFAKKLLFAKDENLMDPGMLKRRGGGDLKNSRSPSRSFNNNSHQGSGEKGGGVKVSFKKKEDPQTKNMNEKEQENEKEKNVKNLMMLQSFGPENPKNNILPNPKDIEPDTIFDVEDNDSGMELLGQLGMGKETELSKFPKEKKVNVNFLKEIELLKEENDHLTKAYESLKNEKNQTMTKSNLFQNELVSLQEEVKQLRIELHENKFKHEEEIENKDSEISDFKIEIGALKKHNDMLKKQKKQLEDAQETLQAEKANDSEISFQLKKKIQECQDLQNEKKLVFDQLKAVKLANVQFEIDINNLKGENEDQKNEISDLKKVLEEEKSERKKLELEKYEGGIEDQENIDKTIGELKAKLKDSQRQNRELEESQEVLKKQLEDEKIEKNEVSENLLDLETEHSEKVIELDDKIDSLEEQIQELEDKIKELEELNSELVKKYFFEILE